MPGSAAPAMPEHMAGAAWDTSRRPHGRGRQGPRGSTPHPQAVAGQDADPAPAGQRGAIVTSIGAGVSIVGVLDDNADTDQFDVNLNPGEVYDFWMGPDSGGDQVDDGELALNVSPAGAQVAQDSDSGDGL